MIDKILLIILITLLPFFELRLSIPLGILSTKIDMPFGLSFQGLGLPWLTVFIVAVISNAFLGPIIYFLLDKFVGIVTSYEPLKKLYNLAIKRTQKKIHPLVEKYGSIGLTIFIGLPVPGSGSWSGALGAFLLGMSFKKFVLVNAIGVLIAGILVTLAALGVIGFFGI